jgi:hypothetical protein
LGDVFLVHDPGGRLGLVVEGAVATPSSLGVVGHDSADYQPVAIADAREDPQPTIAGDCFRRWSVAFVAVVGGASRGHGEGARQADRVVGVPGASDAVAG